MDFTIGSLELNRSNPAHLGTKALNDFSLGGKKAVASSGSFESYLMEAIEDINAQQTDVSKMQEKILTDPESVDIHDVTIAMAKAQMSLNLAQTVIDRVVTGWNELSQTR